MTGNEEDVIRFYERFWTKSESWWESDKTLGIHIGYHDKGIRSLSHAVLNMNDVAWRLLNLSPETPGQILDAGCGIGGTAIYLAEKYPQKIFTGITIVPTHVAKAVGLATKHQVASNTRFFEQNYCHTSFPDHTFDGIIALESVIYAHKYKDLNQELYRVLKPGGHIVILDGFRTEQPIPSSLKKIYQTWLDRHALNDVESISSFVTCMKQNGFRNLMINDITSHIFPSYVLGTLADSANFIRTLIKAVHIRNRDPPDKSEGLLAVLHGVTLLVLNRYFKYYSITATK